MNVPIYPKPRFLTRIKPYPESKPERVEPFPLQEQFSGSLPVSSGRPAAEILAEHLVESDPTSTSPVFIP